jgi:hypothetical protein
VLFLDELPGFSVSMLEMLRQPLGDRLVTAARASGTVAFPANFTLRGGDESLAIRHLSLAVRVALKWTRPVRALVTQQGL